MKLPSFDPTWPPEVKSIYHHDMQEIWDPNINRHVWNQYHNQLNTYLDLVPSTEAGGVKKILDVGCAQGTLALMLAEIGHSVVALDLRQSFLDYARTRYTHGDIRFVAGNALEFETDHHFDIIFANQILEHLVYPHQLVGRLAGQLAPDGRLVITTPNYHYLRNNLPSFTQLGDPEDFAHLQFTADADGHFFAYDADELREIFISQGIADVDLTYFETPFISGHVKIRYLHRILPLRVLKLLDRLALSLPLRRVLSHQLMIIGRKACSG